MLVGTQTAQAPPAWHRNNLLLKIRIATGQIYQGKLESRELMGALKYFEGKGTQEFTNIPDYTERVQVPH